MRFNNHDPECWRLGRECREMAVGILKAAYLPIHISLRGQNG